MSRTSKIPETDHSEELKKITPDRAKRIMAGLMELLARQHGTEITIQSITTATERRAAAQGDHSA